MTSGRQRASPRPALGAHTSGAGPHSSDTSPASDWPWNLITVGSPRFSRAQRWQAACYSTQNGSVQREERIRERVAASINEIVGIGRA